MTQFENKIVHFIQEDEENHTFHLIYSKDYDSKLYLGNSRKFVNNVKFPRNVEPGVLKVFDIFTAVETKGKNLDGSDNTYVIEMLSLEDDDFILDKAIFKLEIKEIHKDNIDLKRLLT